MQSTFSTKRRFLIPGHTVNYLFESPLPPFILPDLADRCIKNLLGPIVKKGSALTDIKGRDPQRLLTTVEGNLTPQGEELCFVAGKLLTLEDAKTPYKPFTVSLLTNFLDFQGPHHIRHTTEERKSAILPRSFPLTDIGRAVLIEINHLRIGLELFRSRFFSGMLGFAPTVNQVLLIEANRDSIKVNIQCETVQRKEALPFEKDNILKALDGILNSLLGFKLIEDYVEKLSPGK